MRIFKQYYYGYFFNPISDLLYERYGIVPNHITITGFILWYLALGLIYLAVSLDSMKMFIPSFICLVVVMLTDNWDGDHARRHGLVTKIGAELDRFLDKIRIISTFAILLNWPLVPSLNSLWFAVPAVILAVVEGFAVLLTILTLILGRWYSDIFKIGDTSSRPEGKRKLVYQCTMIGATILFYVILPQSLEITRFLLAVGLLDVTCMSFVSMIGHYRNIERISTQSVQTENP